MCSIKAILCKWTVHGIAFQNLYMYISLNTSHSILNQIFYPLYLELYKIARAYQGFALLRFHFKNVYEYIHVWLHVYA